MVEIFAFVETELNRSFDDVPPDSKVRGGVHILRGEGRHRSWPSCFMAQDAFFRLCDEGGALQSSLGLLTASLPAAPLVNSAKAMISLRDGVAFDVRARRGLVIFSAPFGMVSVPQVIDYSAAAFAAMTEDQWDNFTCVVLILQLVVQLPDALGSYADAEGLRSPAPEPRAAALCNSGACVARPHPENPTPTPLHPRPLPALRILAKFADVATTTPAASLIASTIEGFTCHLQRCAGVGAAALGSGADAADAAAAPRPATAPRLMRTGDPRGDALLALVAQWKLAATQMPLPDVALVVLRCPFANSRRGGAAAEPTPSTSSAAQAAPAGDA